MEFIVPLRAMQPLGDQHVLLVANAIAQAQALLVGRSPEDARSELGGTASAGAVAARVCPGNRASTLLLMPQVDAFNTGALIALYEHRTFVEATLLGINPFDQFGVELGKTLAKPLIAALGCGAPLPPGTDASTAAAIRHAREHGQAG